MKQQKGMALVVVLWMVVLLSIMAASFSLSTRRNTSQIKHAKERAQSLALAEAGIHYALLQLSHPDTAKRWRSDGAVYQVQLPNGLVRVAIFDESGKLDINSASELSLRVLLRRIVGEEEASSLADRILDWRDSDDLARLKGAERKEYQAQAKGYGPQNKNLQNLEELQMVLGITPQIYKRLEPMLSVHSGQDGINPLKASAETLQLALGLDAQTAHNYVKERRNALPNTPPPQLAVTPGNIPVIQGGDLSYTILARAQQEDGPGAGLQVIARRQFSRNNGAPFAFLSWRQEIIAPQDAMNLPPQP